MEKNKPYDFPEHFRDFVFMPKFDDNVDFLASLAEPEDWDYKSMPSHHPKSILRNYLTYTYKRVAEEKKIAVTTDEEFSCWNTGLITKKQEPIFAMFEKNKLEGVAHYWHFWKFCRKGEWDLNKFSSLPKWLTISTTHLFLFLIPVENSGLTSNISLKTTSTAFQLS